MFVYVSNAISRDIHVLAFDASTGKVEPIEIVGLVGAENPSASSLPMAISADHRFLYACLRGEPYPITSFAIDRHSGRLTELGRASLPHHPVYLATNRSGSVLLSASYLDSSIAVSSIDAQGRVISPPMTVTKTEANVHSVLTDPSDRWAYAPCAGAASVMMFRFDPAAGSLAPNSPARITTAAHSRPRHLNFHPSLPILYVLTEEAATVNVYAIDGSSGTLSELQSMSMLPPTFSGEPHTADLHVTPNGRFLFASERKTSILTGFAVDPASGLLSLIGYFGTETEPRSFAIDPSGAFLLSVGIASHRMSVHAMDPGTGLLEKISEIPVGNGPNWIEIIE